MNQKTKFVGLLAILPLVMVALAPNLIGDADAIAPNRTFNATPDTFYLKGDLTAPAGEAPFGGNVVGDHLVRVNGNQISIVTSFDANPSAGMVYEGWLVDMATGYKLSLGQFDAKNDLFFSQAIVNPWIYDVLVITEEPKEDTDPAPTKPVGASLLSGPFGQ